jgi:hypothetical protein
MLVNLDILHFHCVLNALMISNMKIYKVTNENNDLVFVISTTLEELKASKLKREPFRMSIKKANDDEWTDSRLKDELIICLSKTKIPKELDSTENNQHAFLNDFKYYNLNNKKNSESYGYLQEFLKNYIPKFEDVEPKMLEIVKASSKL